MYNSWYRSCHRFLSALIVIGALAAVYSAPAAAGSIPSGTAPFCIKGCDFGGGSGSGDCSFSSYQQCQATAAGRDATCAANPYYNANAELQPGRGRMSRRKF
jgi:hypothetical protein